MSEELISVSDLASQLGKRKQTVFKVLRRLRIEPSIEPVLQRCGQFFKLMPKFSESNE